MARLAFDFEAANSTVSDTIMLVENTLIQDGTFHLPGKKALLSKANAGRTLAVDVTESPIECPKKTKKLVFRQEKAAYRKVKNNFAFAESPADNTVADNLINDMIFFPLIDFIVEMKMNGCF